MTLAVETLPKATDTLVEDSALRDDDAVQMAKEMTAEKGEVSGFDDSESIQAQTEEAIGQLLDTKPIAKAIKSEVRTFNIIAAIGVGAYLVKAFVLPKLKG